MSFEIDPVRYGQLWEKVDSLTNKVDKLEVGMEELLGLANRSKGSLFAIMSITAGVSTFVGFIAHYFTGK